MLERQAKLIFQGEAAKECRRFRHNQLVADVLDTVDLNSHHFLMIEDRHGNILGVVETEDLLEKVSSPDPVERRRWQEMPLESAVSVRLDAYSPKRNGCSYNCSTSSSEFNATTISTSEEELAALYLNDDLYLRWSSVKQILQHALVDTVTGLPNRMVFERRLNEEWQRLERNATSVCVMLIDLDYFKTINDDFGHAAGDLVLKEIGKSLQRQLRSYDLLVRYGGDEFAAILTGCSASQLSIPIHRIQDGLKQFILKEFPKLPTISLSIGAVIVRSQSDSHSMDQLIREADTSLYRAKENGRGCAFITDLTSENRQPQFVEHTFSLV